MCMRNNNFINYKNEEVRNFYGIKREFADFLSKNQLSVYIDQEGDGKVTIYDKDGNDIETMSAKQLRRRVKIS